MASRAWVVGLLFVSLTGCDGNRCDHPDKTEYSCEPVAPGTPNSCAGGPSFPEMSYDPDKVFPTGCTVRLPECLEAFPDDVKTCDCMNGTWECPV